MQKAYTVDQKISNVKRFSYVLENFSTQNISNTKIFHSNVLLNRQYIIGRSISFSKKIQFEKFGTLLNIRTCQF